jgi:UDPglucose 6-dehydrogenase
LDLLREKLGSLQGRRLAIWGLTYKPGTDTLRRSISLETAKKLADLGAMITAHDPAISALPAPWADIIELSPTALGAARGAEALVVSTPWPQYREIAPQEIVKSLARPLIVDPAGFLRGAFCGFPQVQYASVGYARG